MAVPLSVPPSPSLLPAGNGVRPFFRGAPPAVGNAIRPFIRPPLGPTGLGPILPRLGPKGLALGLAFGAGFAVGTWLWNLLNRKNSPGPPATGPGITWNFRASGSLRTDGNNTWTIGPGTCERLTEGPPGVWTWQPRTINQRVFVHPYSQVQNVEARFEGWTPNGPNGNSGFQTHGVWNTPGGWWTFFTENGGMVRNPNVPVTVAPQGSSANVIPAPNPGGPTGALNPFFQPNPVPTPATLPDLPGAPSVAPAPAPPPATAPQADPISPGPVPASPTVAPPVAPPRPRPRPILPPTTAPDTTQPTGPDGRPQQQPQPGPVTRDPDVIDVPGGTVGQPGSRPRPDLVGIATELGKIEQKLELSLGMQTEPPPAPEPDPLLQEILGILTAPYPAGQAQLFPACDRDAQGEPLPPAVAEWPAGAGPLELLSRKVDAVVELLQAHKDFRQPVCRSKPIGEEVTVTFEEVV